MATFAGITTPAVPAGYKFRRCIVNARRSISVNDSVTATAVSGAIDAHLRRSADITCTAEPVDAESGNPAVECRYDWGNNQWMPWTLRRKNANE